MRFRGVKSPRAAPVTQARAGINSHSTDPNAEAAAGITLSPSPGRLYTELTEGSVALARNVCAAGQS